MQMEVWAQTCSRRPCTPSDTPRVIYNTVTSRYGITAPFCPHYDVPMRYTPCIHYTYCYRNIIPKFAAQPVPVYVLPRNLRGTPGVTYLANDDPIHPSVIAYLVNGAIINTVATSCKNKVLCTPSKYIDDVQYRMDRNEIDSCGGYVSSSGDYRMYYLPSLTKEARIMCNLPLDTPGNHSVFLGWMSDGFGIYGPYSQGGKLPILDECRGHTHRINGRMTYHYHLPLNSTKFPWFLPCTKGCPHMTGLLRIRAAVDPYDCPLGYLYDPKPLYEEYDGAISLSLWNSLIVVSQVVLYTLLH